MKSSSKNKGPKIPILMYHEVSEVTERRKRVRSTNPAYSVSVKQFNEQMQYIAKNGHHTLSLNEFIDDAAEDYQKGVAITFDDGFADNYTNAFPLLKDLELTATVFVITDFIGRDKYMDWSQLWEMNQEGISVQSHTVSHRPLSDLSTADIKYELEQSKEVLEDNLQTSVDFVSVPHGMINHKVMNIASTIGYKAICVSEPGFSHYLGNPSILKRINISDRYEISTFKKIVQANQMSILPAIVSKKIKNFAKIMLGYNNYKRIYRFRYRIRGNK